MNNVFISSKSDDWKTPKELYKYFINVLGLFDICPFQSKIDYLSLDKDFGNIYCNPPFSKKSEFIIYVKNYLIKYNNRYAILLLPNTIYGTKYWSDFDKSLCYNLFFINGRLNYNDSLNAPFYSSIVYCNFDYPFKSFSFLDRDNVISNIDEWLDLYDHSG